MNYFFPNENLQDQNKLGKTIFTMQISIYSQDSFYSATNLFKTHFDPKGILLCFISSKNGNEFYDIVGPLFICKVLNTTRNLSIGHVCPRCDLAL